MASSNSVMPLTGLRAAGWLDVVVDVVNHQELVRRYARDVARTVDRDLLASFRELVDDESTVIHVRPGQIRISRLLLAGMGLSRTNACIEHLLWHVTTGKMAQGLVSLAALEVNVESSAGKPGTRVLRIPASEGRLHLTLASQILEGMSKDRLAFSLQSVLNIGNQSNLLYQECLARVRVSGSDSIMLPGSFMPSIERAHLVNEFDRIVVHAVIGKLASNSEIRLGCNISARSAVETGWWIAVFNMLEERPDIAERLIIEITELEPVRPTQARHFARRLRALGCRIAVDDFGVGYGVQTAIAIGFPDIVKLDASLLRNARTGAQGMARLFSLATLAGELANIVVTEGVEDDTDLDLSHRIGCDWAQGYFWGEPTDPGSNA